MPNIAISSSTLPGTSDSSNDHATIVDAKPLIISSTHTNPSDISTSTALTIGSARTTTAKFNNHTDTDADPEYSGFPAHEGQDYTQTTLGGRIKEIMHDNQLVINTFIAGGLAGATSRTVVSPLERLKIILYVQLV